MRDRSDREGKLGGVLGETRRQGQHELRHEDFAGDGQEAEPECHDGEGFLGELFRGADPLGVQDAGELGDEGGVERAPSPNRRRNRLGSFNATKKASAIGPVPSRAAISMSRAKPRTRLTRVQPPTVRMFLSMGALRTALVSDASLMAYSSRCGRASSCFIALSRVCLPGQEIRDRLTDRQLDGSGARQQAGGGRDTLDHAGAGGQRLGQGPAGRQPVAQAEVAARGTGAGQQQVAQSRQTHDGFGPSADGDRQAAQFAQASGHQCGAGVFAQASADDSASGDGDDVLRRPADLRADRVVVAVKPEGVGREHGAHAVPQGGIGAGNDGGGGLAPGDLMGKVWTGQDSERAGRAAASRRTSSGSMCVPSSTPLAQMTIGVASGRSLPSDARTCCNGTAHSSRSQTGGRSSRSVDGLRDDQIRQPGITPAGADRPRGGAITGDQCCLATGPGGLHGQGGAPCAGADDGDATHPSAS